MGSIPGHGRHNKNKLHYEVGTVKLIRSWFSMPSLDVWDNKLYLTLQQRRCHIRGGRWCGSNHWSRPQDSDCCVLSLSGLWIVLPLARVMKEQRYGVLTNPDIVLHRPRQRIKRIIRHSVPIQGSALQVKSRDSPLSNLCFYVSGFGRRFQSFSLIFHRCRWVVLPPSRAAAESCCRRVVLPPSRAGAESCWHRVVLASRRAGAESCCRRVVLA